MTPTGTPTHHGEYRFIRAMVASVLGDRWLALHDTHGTNHIVHHINDDAHGIDRRRLVAAVEAVSQLDHAHLMPIEHFSLDADGSAWLITDYPGNHEGLVTLAHLVELKGGRLEPIEVERVLEQLLDAIDHAHTRGVHHGPLCATQILVDRRGSLTIEHYGLARRLHNLNQANEFVIADEVRSVIEMAYALLTGFKPEEPMLMPSRVSKAMGKSWDGFYTAGLNPDAGFTSPREALNAFHNRADLQTAPSPSGPVRTVLRRFRFNANATRK